MTAKHRSAWDAALWIVEQLRAAEFRALFAGGCVRDRLLGRTPKDFDVVTNAEPKQVTTIFPRAREVGVKFGVMLVRKYGYDTEVATFRSDGPYSDGRHPDAVCFGSDQDDARRRDFTINGMFHDPIDDRLIDYVDGQRDLQARIIRTIGDPDTRFGEDHLRMLRAARFAARLDFEIHPGTAAAIKRSANQLSTISPERVWMELEILLTDPTRATGWSILLELGLRPHLAASWSADPDADAYVKRRLRALPARPISAPLAMASVLTDLQPNVVTSVCKELRLSNRQLDSVRWLLRSLDTARLAATIELADLKVLMAHEGWRDLPELLRADLIAREAKMDSCEALQARANAVPADEVSPPPLVTGDDLCDMGVQPGPELGKVLAAIRRAQLNTKINSREEADAMAKDLLGR